MARLIGVGQSRLQKAHAGTVDMRWGTKPVSEQSDSVRGFLHRTYTKLGECMPDKFIRRGRAKKRPMQSKSLTFDDDSSNSDCVVSCDDDDSDLLEWLDRSTDTALHNACLNSKSLVKRWLPPGNLAELYDHYQISQSMIGGQTASLLASRSDCASLPSSCLFGFTSFLAGWF